MNFHQHEQFEGTNILSKRVTKLAELTSTHRKIPPHLPTKLLHQSPSIWSQDHSHPIKRIGTLTSFDPKLAALCQDTFFGEQPMSRNSSIFVSKPQKSPRGFKKKKNHTRRNQTSLLYKCITFPVDENGICSIYILYIRYMLCNQKKGQTKTPPQLPWTFHRTNKQLLEVRTP